MIPRVEQADLRIAEPRAKQENVREYRGKYSAFYFRHVEFDVPPGRRKQRSR